MQIGRDLVRAVLVADDAGHRNFPNSTGSPAASVAESSASRRSRTRCITLDMCPSHVGVQKPTMSASMIRARIPGHWSEPPMSASTPERNDKIDRPHNVAVHVVRRKALQELPSDDLGARRLGRV